MSEETRNIISMKAKDRYKLPENNPMYGKTHSESTLKKMKEKKCGSNNPMFGSSWNENQRSVNVKAGFTSGQTSAVMPNQRRKRKSRNHGQKRYCAKKQVRFTTQLPKQ